MLNNDACVGWSPLTSEVLKDRVMVISLMVGCWRTRAETGIVWTEKGSVRLVMLMIKYVSAERLRRRWRQSWICDTECNTGTEDLRNLVLSEEDTMDGTGRKDMEPQTDASEGLGSDGGVSGESVWSRKVTLCVRGHSV